MRISPSTSQWPVVSAHFEGPFSVVDDVDCRCLFDDAMAGRGGVYLWTIDTRPWYVGHTRRDFGQRTGEHVAAFLSGRYGCFDPVALARGENRLAGPELAASWPKVLPALLRNYDQLQPQILAVLRRLRVHCVPLGSESDLHERVEGTLGRYFLNHPEEAVRNFVMPGMRMPVAKPATPPIRLLLSSDSTIAHLPPEIVG